MANPLARFLPMTVRKAYRAARDGGRAALRDLASWNLTEDDVREIYGEDYHQHRDYVISAEEQARIKSAHADFIVRHTTPKKVLVAGCSGGQLVRALRERGVEAWGFDISPDLDSICYPDVRPWVRSGSLTAIPYNRDDGFDVIVAIDVFEHVPRRSVRQMVGELRRLGTPHLVTLINHISVADPGHISLFPMWWWQRQLRGVYRLRPRRAADLADLPAVYGLDRADDVHVVRVWDV